MKTLLFSGRWPLSVSVKKDIKWWSVFLHKYNGVSMMAIEDWSEVDKGFFITNACLKGCGAWHEGRQFFHCSFPSFIQDKSLDINCLELLMIIVASYNTHILSQILAQLDLSNLNHTVFWTVCLIAFSIFARKSNLFYLGLRKHNYSGRMLKSGLRAY